MFHARQLVSLPWHWIGPVLETDEHGQQAWVIRVEEFEDFFVAGDTRDEVLVEVADAFETFLETFEDEPDWPRLPRGFALANFRELGQVQQAAAA